MLSPLPKEPVRFAALMYHSTIDFYDPSASEKNKAVKASQLAIARMDMYTCGKAGAGGNAEVSQVDEYFYNEGTNHGGTLSLDRLSIFEAEYAYTRLKGKYLELYACLGTGSQTFLEFCVWMKQYQLDCASKVVGINDQMNRLRDEHDIEICSCRAIVSNRAWKHALFIFSLDA